MRSYFDDPFSPIKCLFVFDPTKGASYNHTGPFVQGFIIRNRNLSKAIYKESWSLNINLKLEVLAIQNPFSSCLPHIITPFCRPVGRLAISLPSIRLYVMRSPFVAASYLSLARSVYYSRGKACLFAGIFKSLGTL